MAVWAALLFACPVSAAPTSTTPGTGDASFAEGLRAYQRGAFALAVTSWLEAARAYADENRPAEESTAQVHLARAYQNLGEYDEATRALDQALAHARRAGDPKRIATALVGIAALDAARGRDTARSQLDESLRLAREAGDPALVASVLHTLGNHHATQKRYREAVEPYRESAREAAGAGQRALAARALTNLAMVRRHLEDADGATESLAAASEQLRGLPPSHESAYTLIGIGLAYRDLRPLRPAAAETLLRLAGTAFSDAASVAGRSGDARAASYAWGNLGTLYEEERRFDEALELTRRAILAAQRAGAPESLYRWQWQSARLLVHRGGPDQAIAAYRRALETLQGVRSELATAHGGGAGTFRESVGPVFLELVDLLLRRSESLPGAEQAAVLKEARETVELLKAAELRDYFRDDCVEAARARVATLEAVSRTAVVVYPILLPTRLELLVSVPSGLRRKTVPVGAAAVTEEVRRFRRALEKRTTHEYRPHAQQLYAWLIRPIEAELAEAAPDTLVFVPDGPLRTIPMAALLDGDQFLAARYAIAITPGLSLTDPRPMKREGAKVLAAGVTQAVQGFSALPNVRQEVEMIHDLYGGTALLNRDFRLADVRRRLRDERFTMIHIASHARFGNDVGRTFLVGFDDRLTMDGLDEFLGVFRFRDEPLDLLTLSACDTAIGDDRAALGLAGVAIKAGARSAVATLWHINDRASAELMGEFYRQLQEPSTSRARALNRAQLKLLNDPRYEHPGYWSPFLLINNWL